MAAAPGLRLVGVERGFGRRPVLGGVDLTATPGEVVALVGRNGAGKTTLLRLAVGVLEPGRGEVTVDGHPPSTPGPARPSVGYVAEGAPLPGDATVDGFLRAQAALRGGDRAARVAHVAAARARLGVDQVAPRTIATLSRGWRQRVALAEALAAAPRLLVLDEPTDGLDPETTRALWAELAELAAPAGRERVVLLASHDPAEVAAVATRVVVMAAGRVERDVALAGDAAARAAQVAEAMP